MPCLRLPALGLALAAFVAQASAQSVLLQPTTPGIQQSGNTNISGRMMAGNLSIAGMSTSNRVFTHSLLVNGQGGAGIVVNSATEGIVSRGDEVGVYGQTIQPQGVGVLGENMSLDTLGRLGSLYGVEGMTGNSQRLAIYGQNLANLTFGALGADNGVCGWTTDVTRDAVLGLNAVAGTTGILGGHQSGVEGLSSDANLNSIMGTNAVNGTSGLIGGQAGVGGHSTNQNFSAVAGDNTVIGTNGTLGGRHGVTGEDSNLGTVGYLGGDYAVHGDGNQRGGMYASTANPTVYALEVHGPGLAALLDGAVVVDNGPLTVNGHAQVNGSLSVTGSKQFKIDHPLDPVNKYLVHSCIESPDMMNIYNGNVTTDDKGSAIVNLPSYFEALNRDYRYQLTVLGQFAEAIVAEEIADNRFAIKTDKPGVKVSWQVTGIRQDAWAKAHPMEVEPLKVQDEGRVRQAH